MLRSSVSQLIDTGETRWLVHMGPDGSRVGESAPKNAEHHLLGVGDSFAFGTGVDMEATFAALLDQDLNGVAVHNLAPPGWVSTRCGWHFVMKPFPSLRIWLWWPSSTKIGIAV